MPLHFIPDALLIDPGAPGDQTRISLLIRDGQTEASGPAGSLQAPHDATVIEAPGLCISPGWVDLLSVLQDPGHEQTETLDQLAAAAAAGGFTRVLCHPATLPHADRAPVIAALVTRSAAAPVHLMHAGAMTVQMAGKDMAELLDMLGAGAAAITDGGRPAAEAGIWIRVLQYLQPSGALLTASPYDASIAPDGQMNEGEQAVLMGMRGVPELAEVLPAVRLLEMLAYAGGRLHLQPFSSPEALLRVQQHAARGSCTTGVLIHHLALTDEALAAFDSVYKAVPPLRSEAQRRRLIGLLREGAVDVLATGHHAQAPEDKAVEFPYASPGMLALQTAFSTALEALIRPGYLSLQDWVRLISLNPRRILGLKHPADSPGSQAEWTLFSTEGEWTLRPEMIPSRAVNSPWLNRSLPGRVIGIFAKGRYTPVQY
ncbi:MAG: hypothetical protein NW241_21325 [Bacteroidia bacterium]|nr:hypothetical protein [Bacteroidia bacterium]